MKKRGILVCAILFFVCVAGGIGYVTLCMSKADDKEGTGAVYYAGTSV